MTSGSSSELPNMPKYQPCPKCSRGCKRLGKAMGGADYICPTHGKFFIKSIG